MGFDLYGENPKQRANIDKFPTYSKYVDMNFSEKLEKFEKDEKLQTKYYNEMSEYEEANPGNYFRNNCWWWRPLWSYVCDVCDHILDEEDMEHGSYNDGHVITEDKAIAIADVLDKLLDAGDVDKHMVEYEAARAQAEVNNEGKKCSEDGYDWSASYPFDRQNIEEFSVFCRESGGFSIC